jgi:hypothetical protein
MKPQLCFIILSTLAIVIAFSVSGGQEAKNEVGKPAAPKGGHFGSITFEVPASAGNVNVYEGEVYARVKVAGDVDGDGVVGKVIKNDGTEYEQRTLYPTGMNNEYDAMLEAPSAYEPGPYPGFRIEVTVDFIVDPDTTKAQTGLFGVNQSEMPMEAPVEAPPAPAARAPARVAAKLKGNMPEITEPDSGDSLTPAPVGDAKRYIKVKVDTHGEVEEGVGKVRARAIVLGGSALEWGNLTQDGGTKYSGKIEAPYSGVGTEFRIEAEVHYKGAGKETVELCCFTGLSS